MNRRVVVFIVLAGAAGVAARDAAAEERVTAPSLPSQPNKDSVVMPSGGLKTTRDGIVYQAPSRVRAAPVERSRGDGAAVSEPPLPNLGPPKSAPGPLGAPVVNAAYVTRRGVVAKFEKGASITIVEKSGKARMVPLARNASVYADLKVGDEVALRIPFDESADGKTADRVEKQKPPALDAPRSKFSQAQVKGN